MCRFPAEWKHPFKFLFFLLIIGLSVLTGRFDWSQDSFQYSLRSYAASAFFLTLLIPSVLYWALFFTQNSRVSKILTFATTLICSLPYHTLGLERFFYHHHHPVMDSWKNHPLPEIAPFGVPHPVYVFAGLVLMAVAVLATLKKKIQGGEKLFCTLFILILIEAGLHLSLRSPYTYIPHFEQPAANQYWYHYYLLENEQGAVNLDYHAYRPTEELFLGEKVETSILAGRPFPTYLASQFLGFISPYYVWLFLNILFWFLGVFCIYRIGAILFDADTGKFAATFLALSQGMILYVAQPFNYSVAIAGTVVVFFLYLQAVVEKGTCLSNLFFGIALGLWLLCYENQPWFIAYFALSIFYRVDLKKVLVALFAALAISQGFPILVKVLPQMGTQIALAPVGGHPIDNLVKTVLGFKLKKLFFLSLWTVRGYFRVMLHAFNFALLPALVGFYLLRKEKVVWVLGLLLLPSVLTYAVFEMGESFYTKFPRLVYSSYPAIFLAAGYALARLKKAGKRPIIPLFLYTLYVNLDVLGFPIIYYIWFYRDFGFSL